MQKQFVTYEIAKKLKELGFDEPCFGFYNEICEDNDKANCSGKFQNMCGWVLGRENTNDLSSHDFLIVAPLWQQAIDWLREKHNIWLCPQPKVTDKICFFIFKGSEYIYSAYELSYEEARQKAIEEALKLI